MSTNNKYYLATPKNYSEEERSKRPDVIILRHDGDYSDSNSSKFSAEFIIKEAPEYVLDCGWGNKRLEDLEPLAKKYSDATLEVVLEKEDLEDKDLGLIENGLKHWHKQRNKHIKHLKMLNAAAGLDESEGSQIINMTCGYLPTDYQEFLKTPFFELDEKIYHIIAENLDVESKLFRKLCNAYENDPRTEEEKRLDVDISGVFDRMDRLKRASEYIRSFEDTTIKRRAERVLYAAGKANSKIAGCDLDHDTITLAIIAGSSNFETYREEVIGQRIVEYANNRETDSPIIVLLHNGVAEKTSRVYSVLDDTDLTYCTLDI